VLSWVCAESVIASVSVAEKRWRSSEYQGDRGLWKSAMPSITCAGSSREMQANSGEPGVARIRDRSQDGPVRGCEQPTKTDCVIGATKDLHSLDKTPVREHLRYSSDCCHRVPQWRKPVPGYFGRHWKLLIRPACDGSGRGDIKVHGIQAVVREHTVDPGQRRQPPVESNGQQRRSDSMASDIDHAERDLVIVRRDDVERVAGQFHTGMELPAQFHVFKLLIVGGAALSAGPGPPSPIPASCAC